MGVEKTAKQAGGAGKGGDGQGTYFERLRAVADLRYDDSADDAAHQLVLDKIGECEDLVRKYAQANGFRSEQVRAAIDEWARAFLADLGATRDQLRDGRDVVVQARGVMRQARDLFQANVSDELLTGGERGWRLAADVVGAVTTVVAPLGGFLCFLGVETYFSGLEKERDREREEYCQNVIEQMNASLNEGADRMQGIIDKGGDATNRYNDEPPTPSITSLPGVVDPNLMGGAGGGSGAGSGFGAGEPLGGSGAGGLDGSGGSGGVLLPGRDWASEGFARPGAIQDPPPYAHLSDVDGVGLVGRPVNQTVTPNGLVGGYAPPSAVHASDPRWDPSYRIPHDAVSVGRAASSGALGALAGGAGISARSLLSGAAGLGAAGAAGAKGAAGLGAAGAAGAKGAAGLGAAGLKGGAAAARGGAGGLMGMGAPVGGAGGQGGDEKKKRRPFTAVFAGGPDEEAGPVWDPAHGPGSADDGTVLEVDLDEWGL